jgi:hypothetical protein
MMKTIANVMSGARRRPVLLWIIMVLGACLPAGCSLENLLPPPPEESLGVGLSVDGVATLSHRGHDLVQHARIMLVLDDAGQELAHWDPCFHHSKSMAASETWPDAYPGVAMQLGRSRGGLVRLFHVGEPLDLPEGAHTVEFVETMILSPGLRVTTDQGVLAPGQTILVAAGFRLVGDDGQVPFHTQAAVAWDVLGRNRPWLEYRLTLQAEGVLLVGTRVPAAWLTDPAAGFPLTLDSSIVPEAPASLLGAIFLAPTAPGARTVSLAATYANARLDSLEVTVDWGDGAVSTQVTNCPLQELHTYPSRRREVTILLQVSDFSKDEGGQLAPRIERRLFRLFGPPETRRGRQRHAEPEPEPEP